MQIFTDWFGPNGAGQMLARFGHMLAGVTWIGLLYYFNLVQAPAFGVMSQTARRETLTALSKRAEEWVRWSALATVATGLLIFWFQRSLGSEFRTYFSSTRGTAIAFGAVLGILMWLNVWLVIHPAQRELIDAAEAGHGTNEARGAARRLACAQRCNTLFSIPMLWFMAVTPHFAGAAFRFPTHPGRNLVGAAWVVFIVIVGCIELSAVGQIGGLDSLANRTMFNDWRRTIAWGFVLWAILWFGAFEAIIGNA